jgi:3-oxoadipate enol-lactonase/4-carboxymuconolactone decarboxylase
VVIVGAPGTSVRFWTPVMEALRHSSSTLFVEYRGFPDEGRVLPAEELTVGRAADDLEAVLRAEGVERFHLASWCLGAKLAWETLRRHPERVLSVAAVGTAFRGEGEGADGPFARAMRGIRERVERDPAAAPAMIRMMRLSGFVPDDEYFVGIRREAGDGAGEGGAAAALPFHHNGTPCGLRNYLPLYEEFDRFRVSHLFPATRVPVTVATGDEDRITPLDPGARAALDAIPGVRYETVEGATHYLPVELPGRLAELLARHVERAAPGPVPA